MIKNSGGSKLSAAEQVGISNEKMRLLLETRRGMRSPELLSSWPSFIRMSCDSSFGGQHGERPVGKEPAVSCDASL